MAINPEWPRLIMGNPLIMQQMARHVPDAGSYAPVTVLVDERSDGVHISYDRMVSLLAPYRNSDAADATREASGKVGELRCFPRRVDSRAAGNAKKV